MTLFPCYVALLAIVKNDLVMERYTVDSHWA